MNSNNLDKTSDAPRSDPQVADEKRKTLAKQAERKVKEADGAAAKDNSDASR